MDRLTERSVVKLFRYRPTIPAAGYQSMLRLLESTPAPIRRELADVGLSWDLEAALEVRRKLADAAASETAVEDLLLERGAADRAAESPRRGLHFDRTH